MVAIWETTQVPTEPCEGETVYIEIIDRSYSGKYYLIVPSHRPCDVGDLLGLLHSGPLKVIIGLSYSVLTLDTSYFLHILCKA
jgi:hypothetical protein